jgi:hypothetical protein
LRQTYVCLAWALIAAGIFLRLLCYFHNRSFWTDEAALAVNILDHDFGTLTHALDHRQAAPLLFLWAEKCAHCLWEPGEFSLRTVPLLCGVVSVPLFFALARTCLSRWASLFALSLFALSEPLIRYATELKQYGGDVLCVLVICCGAVSYLRSPSRKGAILLGVVGAFTIWLSFPAIFVLAGLTGVLTFTCVKQRMVRWPDLALTVPLWCIALIALYFVQLVNLAGQRSELEFYGSLAFPPADLSQMLSWLSLQANQFTYKTLDLHIPLLFGASSLVGAAALARSNGRMFFLLMFPLLPISLLSSLHLYPIVPRFLLFLAPAAYILLARGLDAFIAASSHRPYPVRWAAALVSLVCVVALLWSPTWLCLRRFTHPLLSEEVRPAMRYIEDNWRPGDFLYVYGGAANAFRYYSRLSAWDDPNFRIGSSPDIDRCGDDLHSLEGKRRVWVLISHTYIHGTELPIGRFLTTFLKKQTVVLKRKSYPYTQVFLCDMNKVGGEDDFGRN